MIEQALSWYALHMRLLCLLNETILLFETTNCLSFSSLGNIEDKRHNLIYDIYIL